MDKSSLKLLKYLTITIGFLLYTSLCYVIGYTDGRDYAISHTYEMIRTSDEAGYEIIRVEEESNDE